MSDEIVITLPVSGKKVVIRNYTTVNDDEMSEQVLYEGVAAGTNAEGDMNLSFPIANVMNSKKVYIKNLVSSIDGITDRLNILLGELRTADYTAISEAVGTIVEQDSPKALAAKTASKNNTK